ncbi:MAG TPA: energy transducer TonB [Novosphingobium sp.]
MRRIYNSIVLFASAALFHASPLLAAAPQRGAAPANLHSWVKTVNARIDDVTTNPTGLTGTATALFRIGEAGRPIDVEIRDATPAMERAARLTLERVGHLPALPQGIDRRQRIKLQLLLDNGNDVTAFQRKRQDMLAAAEAANGRIGGSAAPMFADLAVNP